MSYGGIRPGAPAPQPAPARKSNAKLFVLVSVALALALCVIGLAVVAMSSSNGHDAGAAPLSTPTTYGSPSRKAAQPKRVKDAKPATIGEGTWVVGKDVKAGKYQTAGAEDSMIPLCYWDVRKGSEDGEFITQGTETKTVANGYVTLKNGQYFKTSGCKSWAPVG